MSQETVGNIRGFVPYEYIVNYIKNNIDSSVTYKISRTKYCKIKDCDWHYKINEHSEDDEYYYYVKAVPKIAVSAPDVKVQKIYSRRNVRRERND